MLRSMQLKTLNPHITCVLCGGYLVDATTIIECLHSFCSSCIARYLETSFHCPVCDVEIHKTKPLLHIRPDRVLQDIVYKLVPDLCHEEHKERKELREQLKNKNIKEPKSEGQGTSSGNTNEEKAKQNDCPDIDDPVCISLEYYGRKRYYRSEEQVFPTRYLRCSSKLTVGVLKKFLSIKFGIPPTHQPELVRSDEILDNHITMRELSRIYGLYAKSFLDIQYIFLSNEDDAELKSKGHEAKKVKIDHLERYRENEQQQQQTKRKRRRRKQKQINTDPQKTQLHSRNRKRKNQSALSAKKELVEQQTDTQSQQVQHSVTLNNNPLQQLGKQIKQEQLEERLENPLVENLVKTASNREQQQRTENSEEKQPKEKRQKISQNINENREQPNTAHEQQCKENEKKLVDFIRDKSNIYQLNKYNMSVNDAENETKESLDLFRISPPLRSRNLENTSPNCTETFSCPTLKTGIEPGSSMQRRIQGEGQGFHGTPL